MNKCVIYYHTLTDEMRREDKLEWFSENKMPEISFRHIFPDKNNNWLNQTENDWETLLPLVTKKDNYKTLFQMYSLGASTNRDEWVFSYSESSLVNKINYFIKKYNELLELPFDYAINDTSIKWSEQLKRNYSQGKVAKYDNTKIVRVNYRPFIHTFYYAEKLLSDRLTLSQYYTFGQTLRLLNYLICITDSDRLEFNLLATNSLITLQFFMDPAKCLPLYRYDTNGNRIDNITDWGLEQFRTFYHDVNINKEDIFHYVYAVLHEPAYRKKYELNLKRDFPRIPFYDDFWKWSEWGKELMELHINFETVEPAQLTIETHEPNKEPYKPKLKANKETGEIYLDNQTTISGIPRAAWNYKLGNRSALEWILDQYKEKKPKDPTIAEKFNNYRFADYKDKVTELICRVTTVSVKTMEIIDKMSK